MTVALTLPVLGFEIPFGVAVLGAITGITYGLFAMGLTLTYQSSRALNFAQGAMGALPHFLVASLVIDSGISYWVALPLALASGAAVGALTELVVIRRLAHAPRLVVLVATIGVAQIVSVPIQLLLIAQGTGAGNAAGGSKLSQSTYPTPFDASVTVGGVKLLSGQMLILAVAPLLMVAVTAFLRRTRVGMASRAAADNEKAAQLAGAPIRRISLAVWTVAGVLSAFAAILAGPTRPILSGAVTSAASTSFGGGGDLLLRGLGAAMLGGLVSLPQVFGAGVLLGITENLIQWNYPSSGVVELVMAGAIIFGLLARRDLRQRARGGEDSSWSLSGSVRTLPRSIAALPRVRAARAAGTAVLGLLLVAAPLPASPSQRVLLSAILLFAVMGLSLVILTGWGGQVSLGQFTFVAIGAVVGGRLAQLDYPTWSAVVLTVAAGAVAAVVVGLPALRIRGLFLAVTTLAFAVAANDWLFAQPWLVTVEGGTTSLRLDRVTILGIDLHSELSYYYLCAVLVVAATVVIGRIRRTGLARMILAVRDNEPMAMSMSLSPASVKLLTFVLSGAMASLAGYFYGMLIVNYGSASALANPGLSQQLVTLVIFGGATTVTGAVLGAAYVRGIPYVLHSQWAIVLSSGAGLLVILLLVPGGLASLAFRLRDRIVTRLAGGPDGGGGDAGPVDAGGPAALAVPARAALQARPRAAVGPGTRPLEVSDVVVRYGGVLAVRGVSLHAERGEIVGLLGPNGAGKTTLFDVLSGHVRPDSGRVLVEGWDVTDLPAAYRARLGLVRSFQQARLFDELQLVDAVKVAMERLEPSEAVPSLLGLPPSRGAERRKELRAHEVVEALGLGEFAERRCMELSTGVRRAAELACVVASGSQLVLLDEPTAGLAQRDLDAFTPLIRQIRDHLDATMVVVSHDVPVITSLAERVYVLAAGEVIAEGPPGAVVEDPRVIESYFGTPAPAPAPPRRARPLVAPAGSGARQ